MVKIRKATPEDASEIVRIGRKSFIEAHHTSAPAHIFNSYLDRNFTLEIVNQELSDPFNHFYLIFYKDQLAGYSKIIFDSQHPNIITNNITKLERLYLLQEFYNYKLGYQLYQFNVELSKKENQKGMWLFVWVENQRAINFYLKTGFKIVGKHDFKLSEDHSNPNHQMFLAY